MESLGLKFSPSGLLTAALNQDTYPLRWRLSPKKIAQLNNKYSFLNKGTIIENETGLSCNGSFTEKKINTLFRCFGGRNCFRISPNGKLVICAFLHKPSYDLFKKGNTLNKGLHWLKQKYRILSFFSKSKCATCTDKQICMWCPGRAYLEKGDPKQHVDYYCALAKELRK